MTNSFSVLGSTTVLSRRLATPLTILAVALTLGSPAAADTLHLDGYTSTVQTVSISSSPISGTTGNVGATGFDITNQTTGESDTYWCLDIAHYLMGVGASQTYNQTNAPWSNSFGLTETAKTRIQAVFDANWGSLDLANGDVAAAFQMSLWEAAFEGDANAFGAGSLGSGAFQATSSGSDALAATFLTNAANYLVSGGPKKWNMAFWEVLGADNRGLYSGQNLVTVSAVPLPAAGLLLAGALAVFGRFRRRRATV